MLCRILSAHIEMLTHTLLVIGAYLLGSASTAIIACRLLGRDDPRRRGSGNPGATNVLRTGGRQAAAITLLGDVLKGLAPVIIARILSLEEAVVSAIALAAFCGHIYPIYHGFKGGKGVATALGVLLGMHTLVGVYALLTWLAVAFVFRFASLASLVTGLLTPVYMLWISGSVWLTGTTVLMAVLIFWRHRGNIRNLLEGTENTIGGKI
jgi:glycerol-3-phosphate acyltransferase PlsY